ncbi:MAG: OmpA family protein [Actinomycetota bacterium]
MTTLTLAGVAMGAVALLEQSTARLPEAAAPTSLAWLATTTAPPPERAEAGAEMADESSDPSEPKGDELRAAPRAPVGLLVDPDGGGVVVDVDANGLITMAGPVPDLATVQRLEALFAGAGLAGATNTAELTVAADAPRPTGRVVIDNNLLFPIGADSLRPAGVAFLTGLATAFEQEPNWTLTVTAHTDNTGGPEHNQRLSAIRAGVVLAALVDAGVPEEAMTAIGAGLEFPVGDNRTVAGRNQNRRIEIQIITA